MQWYRRYHGTYSDPKFAGIARKTGHHRTIVLAVWDALLEEASASEARGSVAAVALEDVAAVLDVETETVAAIHDAFMERGMIAPDGHITAWSERQRDGDSSTERVRRHREANKHRAGNGDETHETRSVTSPDTDTDTDIDIETQKASPSSSRPPKPERVRATRITDDWALSDDAMAWSLNEARAPPDMIQRESAKFLDYWRGVPGEKGRKADWDATWRNWLRRAVDDAEAQRRRIGGRQAERDDRRAQQADAFRAAVGGGMGPGGRA